VVERARITVIAGVNGAGKSSIAGESLRQSGGEYFNPDEATRTFMKAGPSLSLAEANVRAWEEGRRRLEEAIRDREDFTFETTLGGASMTKLLFNALDAGLEVAIFYVGLSSVELHLSRVRSRVSRGGHDIPEAKVRERYTSSLRNLVKLAPRLGVLQVLDNSFEADPETGHCPQPEELLHAENGKLVRHCELSECPAWAKPVFTVLLRNDSIRR
jgi:predicted ABC-type ATPase